MKKQPVLVVVEGGIAEVRYCPPGIVVLIKDYDGDCDDTCDHFSHRSVDAIGEPTDNFHLKVEGHGNSRGKEARVEAQRIMREEKIR
jgi:hypothetical protein